MFPTWYIELMILLLNSHSVCSLSTDLSFASFLTHPCLCTAFFTRLYKASWKHELAFGTYENTFFDKLTYLLLAQCTDIMNIDLYITDFILFSKTLLLVLVFKMLQEPIQLLSVLFQMCNDFAFLQPICKTSWSRRVMALCPLICAYCQLVHAITSCRGEYQFSLFQFSFLEFGMIMAYQFRDMQSLS